MKSNRSNHCFRLLCIVMAVFLSTACQNNLVWHENLTQFVNNGLDAVGVTSYNVTATTDFSGTSVAVPGLSYALNGSSNEVIIHIRNPKSFALEYTFAPVAGATLNADDPTTLKITFTPTVDGPVTFRIGVYIPETKRTCPDLVIPVDCKTGYLVRYVATGALDSSGNVITTNGTVPHDTTIYTQGDTVTVAANPGNIALPGYSLWGWSQNNTLPNATETSCTVSNASITFQAVWAKKIVHLSDISPTGVNILTGNITIAPGELWTCVGGSDGAFSGIFDGQGFSINGLQINDNNPDNYYEGLFGYIGPGGVVQNVTLTNVNIVGSSEYTGSIAAYNAGIIRHCAVSGTISGGYNASNSICVGGIAGLNDVSGSIIESYSVATVTGELTIATIPVDFGGLVGANSGYISDCYARGSIIGVTDTTVGGLVGFNGYSELTYEGTIYRSYTIGTSTIDGQPSNSCLIGHNNALGAIGAIGLVQGCFYKAAGTGQNDPYYGQPLGAASFLSMTIFTSNTEKPWNNTGKIWSITPGINDSYPYLTYFTEHTTGVISPP